MEFRWSKIRILSARPIERCIGRINGPPRSRRVEGGTFGRYRFGDRRSADLDMTGRVGELREHVVVIGRIWREARTSSTVPRPSLSPLLVLARWKFFDESNNRACGGARHGGSLEACTVFSSRWVRIFLISSGILDSGDDPDCSAACHTGLDVDVEDPFQTLRPLVLERLNFLSHPTVESVARITAFGRLRPYSSQG